MKYIGDVGESYAKTFLESQGYKIIETNFRYKRFGEIDIIALRKGIYVFCEVKYRTGNAFGKPEESMTHSKIQKCIKTIQWYCLCHNILEDDIRFDVLAIEKNGNDIEVRHHQGIGFEL